MTNLVKYQRAYQAAARLVSTADAMYQTLITLGQ
jgi:flagellar hook-associated protein FlgK